jgi:cobalt-zinc-cadmium efflux system outer membrane protein
MPRLLLSLLLLTIPGVVRAQAPDLRSLTAAALERSPLVRDREKALEGARGELLSARAPLPSSPEVTVETGTDRLTGGEGEYEASLEVDQEVEVWGQRRLRIAAAEAAVEAAERDLEAARLEASLAVKGAWLRLLLLNDRLAALEEIRTLAAGVESATAEKRQAGFTSDVEYRIAAFEAIALEDETVDLRAERDAETAELRRLTGLPDLAAESLAGLPRFAPLEVDVEALARQAVERRPDLAALRAQVASRRSEAELVALEGRPELRLSLGYSRERTVIEGDAFRYLRGLDGTGPFIDRLDDTGDAVHFGATVTLPVFGRNAGERITAQSEVDRAALELQAAEAQAAADVRRLAERLRRGSALLARIQPHLPDLAADLAEVTRAYDLGEYSLDRYLVERDRLIRARLTWGEALLDYLEAVVELERAAGTSLQEPEITQP